MNSSSEKFLYEPHKSSTAQVNVWMAFPGPENFAMSSLGYLWLYKDLDENEYVNTERINTDTEITEMNINEIDFIGFSFSFDTDFINIFSILDKNKIPIKKSDRNETCPIIFAGGPVVTANPTPYEEFFDFFIIGDGEFLNNKIIEIYRHNPNITKHEYMKLISQLKGIYVPGISNSVQKTTEKINTCIYTPIISSNAYFPDTFIIEIARGCANRCGFCLASYINLPLRCLPTEEILKNIDLGLTKTNKIALLGAQLSAHPDFEKICDYVLMKAEQENRNIEMSISSLRVDAVTPKIIDTLKKLGQKNITLAIEAGSERLRKVINKNLTKEQIFNATEIAKNAGLRGFKFYGMIGLPTETEDDINELINLAKELKNKYKGFEISFSFSTFVPKPHTPFQWCGREETKSLERKSNYLQKELHKIGVQVSISSPKWDYWQAVLSRGDSSLSDFLIEVYNKGGKLGAYKQAAKSLKIDSDNFACKDWNSSKQLPWDFIDMTPGKDFLIKENRRLLSIHD